MKRAGLLGLVLAWVRPVSLYSVVLSTVRKPVVDTGSESLSLLKFQAALPLNSICGCLTVFHTVFEIK